MLHAHSGNMLLHVRMFLYVAVNVNNMAVTGGGSLGKCGTLSQHSWLWVRTAVLAYLLTYVL